MKKTKEAIPKEFVSKNGVILEKKLLSFLGYSSDKLPSKEVSDRVTQFFALSHQDNINDLLELPVDFFENIFKLYPKSFKALISLLSESGCRISEALNIRSSDISSDGRVLIRGAKGSSSRFVYPGRYHQFFMWCNKSKVDPFREYDRFYVYRELKKKGVGAYFGENDNASVTHLFRHMAVLDMQKVDTSLDSAKQTIGHKSKKSTEHYGKARRK